MDRGVKGVKPNDKSEFSMLDIQAGQLLEISIRNSVTTFICMVQYNDKDELCFSSELCSGLLTHFDEKDLAIRGDLMQILKIWDRADTEVAWSLEVGNRELLWERGKSGQVVYGYYFEKVAEYEFISTIEDDIEVGNVVLVEDSETREGVALVKITELGDKKIVDKSSKEIRVLQVVKSVSNGEKERLI